MVAQGDSAFASGSQIMAGGKPVGAAGCVSGHLGLVIVRLDRVKEALDAGGQVSCGSTSVALSFPEGVTYGWPEAGAEG
jgi:tRNA-modifying protein YgfZ